MMRRRWIGGVGLTVLMSVLLSPIAATGQYVEISMEVSGSDTVAETFVTDIDWDDVHANPDTPYTWNLNEYYPGPDYYVVDLGNHTATIENISLYIKGGPEIQLGFSAVSDEGPTNFLFMSDVLTFDPLTDVTAYVYATADSLPGTEVGVGAIDFDGKLCRTVYNGYQTFANVIDPYSFIPGGVYEYIPDTAIAGEVSSMQVMWSLNVDGHADGLCTFDVDGTAIPEPATILLLGLGGLALTRKRKA